jgi:hypothetical protein
MQTETTLENSSNFTISRKTFNSLAFVNALANLGKQPLYVKTAWNINRILKQSQKHIDDSQPEVKKILEKYIEKDTEGKYVQDESGVDFKFTDKAAFEAEYQAYMNQEVEFKSHKLKLSVLEAEGVKMSAADIEVLEPLLEE